MISRPQGDPRIGSGVHQMYGRLPVNDGFESSAMTFCLLATMLTQFSTSRRPLES
jgi:hypothetical protein